MKTTISIILAWLPIWIWAQTATLTIHGGTILQANDNVHIVLNNTSFVNNNALIPATSGVHTIGNTSTTIGGDITPLFYDLHIQKSGGDVSLTNTFGVSNNIVFTGGNVQLNGYNLDLGIQGTIIGESEIAHITGMGGGEVLRQAVLDAPVAANPGNIGIEISSSVDIGVTTIHRGHQPTNLGMAMGLARYFAFEPTNNTALNATLRFYYLDSELMGLDENTLSFYRSDNGGTTWADIGQTTRNTTLNYVEISGINSLSRFTLGGAAEVAAPGDTIILNVGEAYGAPDDTVCIPITVLRGDSLLSLQGSIAFDNPTMLQVVGVENGELSGVTYNLTNNAFSFASLGDLSGVQLTDGDTLFCVKVHLIGMGGDSSNVVITNSPVTVQVGRVLEGAPTIITAVLEGGYVVIRDRAQLSGKIKSVLGEGVQYTHVNLSGTSSSEYITGLTGTYAFPNLAIGGSYTITPTKDTVANNGLSTFALIFAQRHIVGLDTLSPYNIIAGDCDCNNSLSTFDLILVQRVIVGLDTAFANCPSWVFVPQDYVFPNPYHPFPFPQTIDVTALAADRDSLNFIGIKKGDILNTVDPTRNNGETIYFTLNNPSVKDGETVTLTCKSANFYDLLGYQFGLSFDKNALTYLSFAPQELPDLSAINMGATNAAEGKLRTNWHSHSGTPQSLPSEEAIWNIQFVAKKSISDFSTIIRLNDADLRSEAYDGQLKKRPVALQFEAASSHETTLTLANFPNPFTHTTALVVATNQSGDGWITVTDIHGSVLMKQQQRFEVGTTNVPLQFKGLASGTYKATLQLNREVYERLMIHQNR